MKKKTQYKIFDNFLDQKTFLIIQDLVMSPKLPFFYNAILNHEQKDDYEKHKYDYYFTHLAYKNDRDNLVKGGTKSVYLENFMPIVEKLSVSSLLRIKVNFYPRTEEMKIHAAHTDYPFDHNGALFYINTCDGYKVLEDGTKIESIANRVLVFNGGSLHSSTSCTNSQGRFNINFNYF